MNAAAATDQRSSDWSLIERVVARDETALAALYDRYSGLLCGILNRILRDAQAAEEILQDVFFQVWRNAAQFDPARGSIAGWLVVAARNRAISRLRRRNPGETEELIENTVVLPFNLESEAAQKEMLGKVRGALQDLSHGTTRSRRARLFRRLDAQRNRRTHRRSARHGKNKIALGSRVTEAEVGSEN